MICRIREYDIVQFIFNMFFHGSVIPQWHEIDVIPEWYHCRSSTAGVQNRRFCLMVARHPEALAFHPKEGKEL